MTGGKPNEIPKRSANQMRDIETLRGLLPKLDDDSILAVYFRFWECMTIQEISKVLGKTWDETDHLIEQSIQTMRDGFFAQAPAPFAMRDGKEVTLRSPPGWERVCFEDS